MRHDRPRNGTHALRALVTTLLAAALATRAFAASAGVVRAPAAPLPVSALEPAKVVPAGETVSARGGRSLGLEGVTVAPATPGAVRFTVEVPAAQRTPTGENDGSVLLRVRGYTAVGELGAPELPVRVVVVAIPPLGDVHVSAATSGAVTSEGVLVAPVAARDAQGGPRFVRSAAAYGTAGSAVPVGARLLEVTWLRNQRIARVAIEPAAYEPAARRLTIASRVDVNVQVQPLGNVGPPAEADDPFEDVYRGALVNYVQGRQWRRPATNRLLALARQIGVQPDRALQSQPAVTSVLYGHSWVKIAVQHTGFYTLNYSTLRSTGLFDGSTRGVPFDSLRLFALPGYPQLPESAYCDTCDLREVAIGTIDVTDTTDHVHNGGPDGWFKSNRDAFYFFAQGPSGWSNEYVTSLPDTAFLDNPYELNSYYYLTVHSDDHPVPGTPRRIATRTDVTPTSGAPAVASFPDRVHFEQDNEYHPNATAVFSTLVWENWFWTSMTTGDQFDFTFDLPGADTTQAARFRLRDWGLTDNVLSGGSDCFMLYSYDHYLNVAFNSIAFPLRRWFSFTAQKHGAVTFDSTGTTNGTSVFLHSVGNRVHLQVPEEYHGDCPVLVDRSALAWFEVYYQHLLQPHSDSLVFRSPAGTGPYHYDVGPFSRNTPPRLFDVTDPAQPVEFAIDTSMWKLRTAGWTLSFDDTASIVKRYQVFPDSMISKVRLPSTNVSDAAGTSLAVNLRDTTNVADYLIIYYDAFVDAATLLANARTQRLPMPNRTAPFATMAVPISAVYDQFSGGRLDPAAIRSLLRSANRNWKRAPKFVVFLGDASYDFKNILGQAGSGQPGALIPSYENEFDNLPNIQEQFSTDDWMLSIDDPRGYAPAYFGGRIPVDDATTALAVLNKKVLPYETSAPFGEYRDRVTLLADDDLQAGATNGCDPLGWQHLGQSSTLDVYHLPWLVDRDYCYLHTYPSGPNYTKPAARTALQAQLDDGVAFFNYIGHGSPFKLTDESVFIDTDANTLTNGDKMFVFTSASCDVGRFNNPGLTSLGERLFLTPTGGAIGVISATGQVISYENSTLANFLYDQFYSRGDLVVNADTLYGVGKYHVPLSAALLLGKVATAIGISAVNNMKYQLLGDPATVPNLPSLSATLTLTNAQGQPATSVARGEVVNFHGQVTDTPGGTAVPLEGTANILIADAVTVANTAGNPWDTQCATHNAAIGDSANYRFKAGTIYHGDVSLQRGQFDGQFIVPMDATLGTEGRLRCYLTGQTATSGTTVDGVSAMPMTLTAGTGSTSDNSGPQIKLSFAGGASTVRPTATLSIDLFDESGILTTEHSIQNSIIVTLDDNTTSRTDVTDSYRCAPNSYQGGQASFTLPGLAVGHHKVTVSAADNLASGIAASQHRSSASLEFDVAEQPGLNITHAYLYPNPIRVTGRGAGGAFVIDAPGDSVNTMVRIYTVAGRVVRVLKSFQGLGQVQIPWDGRDAEGQPLANGVYLFKVYANTREADGSSSPTSRANAEGRIVVLNR